MKLTTWILRNAVAVKNPKAVADNDTAIGIKADSIVKNGKAADGNTINLTVKHLREMGQTQGAGITFADDGTVTIKRSEGKRGRHGRVATPQDEMSEFLKGFNL